MWEPFTEGARQAVVRAQEVAQMFGSSTIGVEHLAFALDEGGDATATALAQSLDRAELKQRLGVAHGAPSTEMVFDASAKRTIELAFENARRLGHNYIGTPHLALGMLATDDPPPLVAGVDRGMLRARLDAIAESSPVPRSPWVLRDGPPHPLAEHVATMLARFGRVHALGPAGTRITVTVAPPGEPEQRWLFERDDTA